jgi:CUE domain
MKSAFADEAEALEHLKQMYPQLPETVIRAALEYCEKNPTSLPEGYETMDISKPPKPKEAKEVVIEGAVEIFDDPNDPRLKVIKHKEGATILTAEEAEELQAKIAQALEEQENTLSQ